MDSQKIKAQLKKRGVFFLSKRSFHRRLRSVFLPRGGKGTPFIIADKALIPIVKKDLKDHLVYWVSAGEDLKNIDHLPQHIHSIFKKSAHQNIAGFVSLGGGSVGDWTGFLASVYKRGRPLIHIPTTWLSAMDSAHGGKSALNVGPVKNALGTYCFPKAVFIVQEFLNQTGVGQVKLMGRMEGDLLPVGQAEFLRSNQISIIKNLSALGEMLKIALIKGGGFYRDFLNLYRKIHSRALKDMEDLKHPLFVQKVQDLDCSKSLHIKGLESLLWEFLPLAISAKLQIVKQDLYEDKGQRIKLNFGHTMGHALELYFNLPHGEAVLYGLRFAMEWSEQLFKLSPSFLKEMSFLLMGKESLSHLLQKIPPRTLRLLIEQDKKRQGEKHIDFIFIKKPGEVFVKKVKIQDLLLEAHRQAQGFKPSEV